MTSPQRSTGQGRSCEHHAPNPPTRGVFTAFLGGQVYAVSFLIVIVQQEWGTLSNEE